MNLAKQFKEFGLRNSMNPMTRDVQTLYYNIFQLFNTASWQPRLEIQTKQLEYLTGMSRKQIDAARNYLIQKGFIKYHKKSGSASPIYEFVFLGETQIATQSETQMATQNAHKPNHTYIDKTKETETETGENSDEKIFPLKEKKEKKKMRPRVAAAPPKDEEPLFFPFDSERFKSMWEVWINYKKEIKAMYRTRVGQQAALKELAIYSEDVAIRMIEQAIAKEWQAIYPLKENPNGTAKTKHSANNQEELSGIDIDQAVANIWANKAG